MMLVSLLFAKLMKALIILKKKQPSLVNFN